MNSAVRIVPLVALLAAGALPVTTGHALLLHLESMHEAPILFVADPVALGLVALSALATVPLARMASASWSCRRARRAVRRLEDIGRARQFEGVRYLELPSDEVLLFTAGARPTIYATAGAARSLPPGPFRAALLHEETHVRMRDVRSLTLLSVAEHGWRIIPGVADLFASLRLGIERRADQGALARGASPADLFDAIVAASSSGPAAVAGLSNAGVEPRLRWLADGQEAAPPVPKRSIATLVAASVASPALAHALLWIGVLCGLCSSHLFH